VRRFPTHICLWLLLLLAPWVPIAAGQETLDDTRQTLKEIEQRIARAAKSLSQKQDQEKALSQDLKTVERELARLRKRVDSQGERLASLKKQIGAAEQKIVEQRSASKDLKEQVNRRLRALYKGGEMGLLRAFFSSGSPARMAEDYAYLGRIVRQDRELLMAYRRRTDELEASLQQLATLRQEQEQVVAAGIRDQENLKGAVQLKKRLLSKVQQDKGQIALELAELKERAARLSGLVKKLESARTAEYSQKSSFFSDQKGRLPWPTKGPLKVGFGTGRHATLGTLYESHGIEIGAVQDQPIAAVWPGTVIFANWFKGYGNLLIVDHGGSYYTLYAQASRLEKRVGDLVQKGETVAYSGFEGNDAVYFEIRHRGTPLDPTAWLVSR
jgi:septal ring factor EnvC (AmiA/AmiB activator)